MKPTSYYINKYKKYIDENGFEITHDIDILVGEALYGAYYISDAIYRVDEMWRDYVASEECEQVLTILNQYTEILDRYNELDLLDIAIKHKEV